MLRYGYLKGRSQVKHMRIWYHSLGDLLVTRHARETESEKRFWNTQTTLVELNYSGISLIRTPKGQSEVSVLERCPYKRGHYDDVTFITPFTVLNVK